MTDHAQASGVKFTTGRVLSISPMDEGLWVSAGGGIFECKAVVLALGVSLTGVFPGEREFLGNGVSYCATCDGMLFRKKRVAVLAMCKEAEHEAEFLKSIGCEVMYFNEPKTCEIRGETTVREISVDKTVYPADGVFIFRNNVAPDILIPGISQSDGHIAVDENMSTDIPGVYAAGDCAGKPYRIAKAVGQGSIAGLSAAEFIEKGRDRSADNTFDNRKL